MLVARRHEAGNEPERIIGADEFAKITFVKYQADGRLSCVSCGAPAVHVAATSAEGGNVERVAHFRAKHTPGCDYKDDPRASAAHESLKAAIRAGKPILVNINMPHKDYGFSKKFDLHANATQTDLMPFTRFQKIHPAGSYHTVSARDISDVLFVIETAREVGGEPALSQLYYRTYDAVQSHERFVVTGDSPQHGRILLNIARRAKMTCDARTRRKTIDSSFLKNTKVYDTPRLVLIKASDDQIEKIKRGRTSSIFARAVMARMPKSQPNTFVMQRISTGMVIRNHKDPSLATSIDILKEGREVWVMGSPFMSIQDGLGALSVYNGTRQTEIRILYPKIKVAGRGQFMATGEKVTDDTPPTPTDSNSGARAKYTPPPAQKRHAWQDRLDIGG